MREREFLITTSSFLEQEVVWKCGTFYLEGDYRRGSRYGELVVGQNSVWFLGSLRCLLNNQWEKKSLILSTH